MRPRSLFMALAFAVVPLALEPLVGLAQSSRPPGAASVPRASDGHPDLQGMWTNATLTTLERPPQFAGKLALSEAEAAAYAKTFLESNDIDRRDGDPQVDVQRAYPNYFLDRGTELAKVDNTRRTSLIIDPPDGRIPPFTVEAEKRLGPRRGFGGDVSNRYDNPEERPLAERCLLSFGSSSGPPMLPVLYNNHYQIVQTRDYVTIVIEMVHDARIIPLDGRPHPSPAVRRWMGDSVGHWEGDTLVVDTTNFSEKVSFRGSSANLHVIERFSRVAADTILYRFTIDDPTTFTRSWSGEIPIRATDEKMYEYACHEGNHALESILRGARFQDNAAIAKP